MIDLLDASKKVAALEKKVLELGLTVELSDDSDAGFPLQGIGGWPA